jgi:hypothetical protein
MKTLATAALLAALTVTEFANGAQPIPASSAQQFGAQKMTLNDVRTALVNLGFDNPEPVKNNNGDLIGYRVTLEYSGTTVPCLVSLSRNGEWINFYTTLPHTLDANTPKEVLLALIAANYDTAPSYVSYNPQNGKVEVLFSMPNANVTGDTLQSALNQYAKNVHQVFDIYKKAAAKANGPAPTQPTSPLLPPTQPVQPPFPFPMP